MLRTVAACRGVTRVSSSGGQSDGAVVEGVGAWRQLRDVRAAGCERAGSTAGVVRDAQVVPRHIGIGAREWN